MEKLALRVPFMLSGGLDAGNVGEALRIARADGLDVSSGVERAPGEKDADMIRAFIRVAREASAKMPPRSAARQPAAHGAGR
jgi:phosphoribosylanthranilate isomerase